MASTLPVTSGLVADYTFSAGSGTTLADASGGGYNATFSGPTWSSAGLTFTGTQSITLPVPIASVGTVMAVVQFNANLSGYTPFLGSDDAYSRTQWWLQSYSGNSPSQGYPTMVSPDDTIYWEGIAIPGTARCLTWISDPAFTYQVYTDTQPNIDHVGGGYTPPAFSSRTGSLRLGSPAGWGFSFPATVSRLAIYSRGITATEVASNVAQIYADLAARAIYPGLADPASTNVLIQEGDSITAGTGASTIGNRWANNLVTNLSYDVFNYGIGGQTIANIAGQFGPRRRVGLRRPNGKSVMILFAGTNDSLASSFNQSLCNTAAYNNVSAANQALGGGMDRVIVVPMLSRGNGSGTLYDANKNAYNTLLAAAYAGSARVSMVPAASLPNLVPDGSALNTTYFSSDQTHPADPGHAQLATAISAAVNGLSFGGAGGINTFVGRGLVV